MDDLSNVGSKIKKTDRAVVFFICFRECLETSIIVSVLLSFLKQTLGPERDPKTYKKLVRQVSVLVVSC